MNFKLFRKNVDFWRNLKQQTGLIVSRVLLLISFISVLFLIYDVGFKHTDITPVMLNTLYDLILIILFSLISIKSILEYSTQRAKILFHLPEYLLLFSLFIVIDTRLVFMPILQTDGGILYFLSTNPTAYILIILVFFIELSKSSFEIYNISVNPALLFILSFLFLIFLGTGLLLLPNATPENGISLIDALFTSTSAVCVTGLIVVDTAKDFTFLGQLFIVILIQLGGLGIMTFTSFFGFFFKGNTSYQSQILLKDLVNEDRLGQIFRTLIKIVLFTIGLELIGTILIFSTLSDGQFTNFSSKLWFAVFHAISGFCNAGFSTLSDNLYETGFRLNYNLHLIIAVLIVIGGLGFPIIFNFGKYLKSTVLRNARKYLREIPYEHVPRLININTKIVVITTVSLILFGIFAFYISEMNNSLAGKSFYGKVVTVIFAAVTPRTAGFNTIDMTTIAMPAILVYLFLMWVGASPGSTGGGIKTTTFALAIMNTISIARGKDRVEAFKREIHHESIRRALSIILMSFLVIGSAIFFITLFDPKLGLLEVIFECFSAFSTVGLSLGITPLLDTPGKLIIIITMFIGRVGTVTLIVAFLRKVRTLHYRYPGESIFIN